MNTMTFPWTYVTTADELEKVLDIVGENPAALDFETTAFVPEEGEVRLAQIYNDDIWAVVDFFEVGRDLMATGEVTGHSPDSYKRGFEWTAHWFDEGQWIVFNAGFEQSWFAAATDEPITCWDVGYLRRAIEGGGRYSLANCLLWDLEHEMDKTQQSSDWSLEPLSDAQLEYAGDDALWTWRLWEYWRAKADQGHMDAFNMFNDMVQPVAEMKATGLILDCDRHQLLVDKWEAMKEEREELIRAMVTEDEVENIRSGKQWNDYFSRILPDEYLDAWPKTEKTGLLSTANKDLRNVAGIFAETPIQECLLTLSEYKTLDKYISSFGEGLISKAEMDPDRRVHADYNIAAARTGRFSCSAPNLQQIPRDRDFFGERLSVRQSFIALPGRQLVSLDYSGIELRVLALLSGDELLLHDMVEGDVHLEMGSYMAGRRLDKKVTEDKEIRQSAKAVSFGIVYGISSLGLSGTLRSSMSRAQELIDYWADRYPRAFDLRSQALAEARDTKYLRVSDGGTIFMGKKPSPTRCANYPVQRAALSVMANAINRHHETVLDLRDEGHDVYMASTIHDALIDDAAESSAQDALLAMKDDMVAGYLDVFPDAPTDRLVEGGVGPNWGELEDVAV